MKKFYRIILLIVIFTFITTYTPKKHDYNEKENNVFFIIKKIEIINNSLIDKEDIESKLVNIYKKNIFFIKRKDIEDSLKEVNFLSKIEVKKKYPDKLIIKIFETEPIAILLKNKSKYLLDNLSNLITLENDENFDYLPSIFGKGAEKNFIDFFYRLKKNNFPVEKIESFYYFQIDRWDLKFKNSQIIKFPENDSDELIVKSIELLNNEDFKNFNIIDLRVDGKIIAE
tara:strand:+ start:336 stop:1019 length:684 start_codon:yes stop_codon:yes gene_type:complete